MPTEPDLAKAMTELKTALRGTIPTWVITHAWWISRGCALILLGFATYLALIGEALSSAMLAAFVLYMLWAPRLLR